MQADNAETAEQYAEALLAAGKATGTLENLEQDLVQMLALVEENRQVRKFLADPFVEGEGKVSAFREILEGKIHHVLMYFVLLLLDQGDILKLRPIAEAFFLKVARLEEKRAGSLVTAHPLSDKKIAEIETEIGRMVGEKVRLQAKVDPDILGGVLVRVGNLVLDGTVVHQLEDIRRSLAS